MSCLVAFLITFVLFFLLTPGILLSLPPRGSKMMVAFTHALVFSIILTLICRYMMKMPMI